MKKIIFILLSLYSYLFATIAEQMDQYIEDSNDIYMKALFRCEHPTKSTPELCIKAAEQLSSLSNPTKEIKNHLLMDRLNNGIYTEATDKEYKKQFVEKWKPETIADMYYNAAVKYESNQKYLNKIKAVQLYEKVLEYDSGKRRQTTFATLGMYYLRGEYVKANKIKTYQYWKIAAKYGSSAAAGNLKILCKRDSWACQ